MAMRKLLLVNLLALTTSTAIQAKSTLLQLQQQRAKREDVDLHNGEFCVDVSTYGEVIFQAEGRDQCTTEFVKRCEQRTEQVCDDVTEIQCDVVPYTECKMTMEATPYQSYQMVPKAYAKKSCTEGMDTVQHTKMMPECRNVTKQNCITKWETDENGNQVWAGNEDCEPVTWRECKLVPRQVDFKVPKIECVDGEEIPYMDSEPAEKSQMTTAMTCEVLHTTSCKPITSTKCQSIQFQECFEEPVESCQQAEIMVPTQEKEHKKKCLLPDDGSFGGAPLRQAKSFQAATFSNSLLPARGGKAVAQRVLKQKQEHPKLQGAVSIVEPSSKAPSSPLNLANLAQASTRQSRRFQGVVSQPRFVQHVQQPLRHQRFPPPQPQGQLFVGGN